MTARRATRKAKAPAANKAPEPPDPQQGPAAQRLPRRPAIIAAAIIIAAGAIVYSNSFGGPEILDDPASISRNPYIRSLWPITEAIKAPPQETVAGRPLVCLSLAVNYAISELDVWSYHAFNLGVHLLAGLVLLGIIRRTLRTDRLIARFGGAADILAAICALVWVVHPLQTQAVDYIIQRAETMMALLYLLTLYCAIRSFHSRRAIWWQLTAAVCCAAGMGTKEVMVSAPLMVLIYDRIFVAKSFGDIFTKRWRLYAALAATWVILAVILWQGPRSKTAGLGLAITPLQYAQAQCGVVLHYLRLVFWPDPLVLDYAWQLPQGLGEVLLPAVGILALLAATVVALRFCGGLGFLGVWFFMILGPSSSFVPIKDLAFEHRMYLPLAAVTTGVVLCAYALGRWLAGPRTTALAAVGLILAAAVAALLGWRSHLRNEDYSTAMSIWTETLAHAPHNPRAHNNLGYAYHRRQQYTQALGYYSRAIELDNLYHDPYSNRGLIYFNIGEQDKAIADLNKAIQLRPDYAINFNSRAAAYAQKGQLARALADLDKAIELDPHYAIAKNNRDDILGHKKARGQ